MGPDMNEPKNRLTDVAAPSRARLAGLQTMTGILAGLAPVVEEPGPPIRRQKTPSKVRGKLSKAELKRRRQQSKRDRRR